MLVPVMQGRCGLNEEETNGPKDGKVTQQNAAADRGA